MNTICRHSRPADICGTCNPIEFAPARDLTIVNQAASIIAKSNNDWEIQRDLRQQIADRDRMIANLKRQLTNALEEIAKRTN